MLSRIRIENLVLIRTAELDLAAGLNAVTGETGAGKTIFAQAIGLLLGARAEAAAVGSAGDEAYVEAEFELPDGFFDDDEVAALEELRPEGEDGLTLARRVRADGRTRAFAWGRSVAREDLAAAAERLISMSGQFEQRRLGRPSYQLDVLDRFCGPEQLERRGEIRSTWRALAAARRRHEELQRDEGAAVARLAELRLLVEATEGLESDSEERLRDESARLRHVTELGAGASEAVAAIAPDDGEGAAALVASAERQVETLAALAPELTRVTEELRDLSFRLRDVGGDLRSFLLSLAPDPARLEIVEAQLETIADTRRRFGAASAAELVERRQAALEELGDADEAGDPLAAAAVEVTELERRLESTAAALRVARTAAAGSFADRVAEGLRDVGMGDGEFRVDVTERELGITGADGVSFLIRPNAGLGFGPVAETASGGELSRVALAIAAVSGGETLVFDEIDAGIGGETAHRVAALLRDLSQHAQVVTITHLPQIASAADRQFIVEKVPGDPTHTRITELDEVSRADELARMLGGREFASSVTGGARAAETDTDPSA